MTAKTMLKRDINTLFYKTLEETTGPGWVEQISRFFESNQESEKYAWLDQVPMMREWLGGRLAESLSENSTTVTNKLFEATLELDSNWLNKAALQGNKQFEIRIKDLVHRCNTHNARLLTDLLIVNGNCYDGRPFFDATHPIDPNTSYYPGTQSNLLQRDVLNTTLPTVTEFQDCLMDGISQIMGFLDNKGQPWNEEATRFIVMVPVSMMKPAGTALGTNVVAGSDNSVQASCNIAGLEINLAINPRLTWTDKFAVFRADGSISPLIRQEETPVQFDMIGPGSEHEFQLGRQLFGVSQLCNVGYGYWQSACLINLI